MRKGVTVFLILLFAGLGVGGFFIWRNFQMPDDKNLNADWYVWNAHTQSYNIKRGTSELKSEIVIPAIYDDGVHGRADISAILDNTFKDCKNLKSITFNRNCGLVSIGENAFYNCDGLTSITLTVEVSNIGNNAFYGCDNLKGIEVDSENITYSSVEGVVYNKKGDTIICVPAGMAVDTYEVKPQTKRINSYAFSGCNNLSSIKIPLAVNDMGDDAIFECKNLTNIIVDSQNLHFASDNGILYSKDFTSLILYPQGKTDSSYTIPTQITEIEASAFNDCDYLTTFNCTGNGSYISQSGVLYSKDLTKLIKYPAGRANTNFQVPNSVSIIGEYAFCSNKDLKQVNLSGSILQIEEYAFARCDGLDSIYLYATTPPTLDNLNAIPSSTSKVRVLAESLETYEQTTKWNELHSGCVTGIPNLHKSWLRWNASVNSYEVVKNVGELPKIVVIPETFNDGTHGLHPVTQIYSPTTYLNGVFASTNIKRCIIPASIHTIGQYSFYNSSIETITFERGCTLTVIQQGTFQSSSLNSITLPRYISEIQDSAFARCLKLQSIYVDELNLNFGSIDGVLYNKEKTKLITYPAGRTNEVYNVPQEVVEINSSGFHGCEQLREVKLSSTIQKLNNNAFLDCLKLEKVSFPSTIDLIASSVFGGCTKLTNFEIIGEGGKYISINGVIYTEDTKTIVAYPSGRSSNSFTIPGHVETVGGGAFYGATNLQRVTIPSSVKYIRGQAFRGSGLTSITIPSNVKNVEGTAFYTCGKLSSVTIQNGVEYIGSYAFGYCSLLTSVTIPASVINIGERVFESCGNLEQINVDASNEYYESVNGVLYNESKTTLLAYPLAKSDTSYTIEPTTTRIGAAALKSAINLTSITLSSALTTIADDALGYCQITSITIPANVNRIHTNAFSGCSKLSSVTFADTTTWYISVENNEENLSLIDVSNIVTNAQNLTNTYHLFYWYKK